MGIIRMNDAQKLRFSRRRASPCSARPRLFETLYADAGLRSIVTELFNTLDGKVITVFGFAFKADTSDTRESPAIDICKTLVAEGARVHVTPPPPRRTLPWACSASPRTSTDI